MNTFKIGDTVKLLKSSYDFSPFAWRMYDGYVYSTVTHVVGDQIVTTEDSKPTHYSHFELYKEPEEDVMKQQKTKRVPFSKAAWEKYKGVATPYYDENSAVSQLTYFEGSTTAFALAGTVAGQLSRFYESEIELEIPITTKRVPFNPELKDAKVFYGKTELIEWRCMSSGVVCGVHEHESPFKSLETALYHPNHLEMEIDEDA